MQGDWIDVALAALTERERVLAVESQRLDTEADLAKAAAEQAHQAWSDVSQLLRHFRDFARAERQPTEGHS